MWGTIIDVVFIAIIVVSAIIGIVKGFFDSILGLIGTTVAGIAGIFLAKYIAPIVNNIFGLENFLLNKINLPEDFTFFGSAFTNEELAKFGVWIITVFATFLIIKFAIFILGKIFERVTKNSPAITGINRVLGMLFGTIKGLIVALGLVAIGSLVSEVPGIGKLVTDKIAETKVTSFAYKYVDEFVDENVTSEKVQEIVNKIVSEVNPDEGGTEGTGTEGTGTEA